MYTKNTLVVLLSVLSFVVLGAMSSSPGPVMHKPENLKILPKNITHEELHQVMEGFTHGLGVKCGFCHAKSASDSTHLDFASDAKPEKNVARGMMKMVMKLNKKYFRETKDDDGKAVTVSCFTCHHGHNEPEKFVEVAKN